MRIMSINLAPAPVAASFSLASIDAMAQPLTALVYETGFPIGVVLAELAARARGQGLRVGGLIELPAPPRDDQHENRHSCDMTLENLASGEQFSIAAERGKLARGCRLDYDVLTRAAASVLAQIGKMDLVLLNKFGKADAEGGGFRCILADALALGIPVAIGVPRRNLEAFRAFAGELAVEHYFAGA